jgi:methylenetetrahydrofolate reductase (NADPH)
MNRNFVESRAFALQRQGISNLLVVTGDYPTAGFLGQAKPVFDLDSVSALHYLSRMNDGLSISSGKGTTRLEKTGFLLGAAVSPFKWTEGPCVMQYTKLEKKIRAGARFVVTQLGYDARKHIELLHFLRGVLHSDVPVLGSVYVLSAGAAEVMNRGEVPGCFVPDELVGILRSEAKAEDKGRSARLERAARQLALLKGLGYSGAHIEGLNLKAEDVRTIVARAGELENGWRDLLPEFQFAPKNAYYYFEGGEHARAPRPGEVPPRRQTRKRRVVSPKFWIMRALHAMLFVPKTPGYRMMAAIARRVDKRKGMSKAFASFEHFVKTSAFNCRHCDDCMLTETFYVCPVARCPKEMRIGPCGGSRVNEKCEVFADRDCVWRNIYWRAKNRGECAKLGYIVPPRDWSLYQTGSWGNYFLKRDHTGHPVSTDKDQG